MIAEEAVEEDDRAPVADALIGDLQAIDLEAPQGVLSSVHRHQSLTANRDGTPRRYSSPE